MASLNSSSAIECCDFYANGLGYQFTVCDNNVGVYILDDLKGGALDFQYLNMSYTETGFNDIPWNELYALIDFYCVNQSLAAIPNATFFW